MIIIEVIGGIVSSVHGCQDDYDVLDWDNLLPDIGTVGDTEKTWEGLFEETRRYVEKAYPESFAKIMEQIRDDRAFLEGQK